MHGLHKKSHAWMRERGMKATFAVPGEQLEQGADIYRELANQGADFINHGALPHTEFRDGRYWSITFYNKMEPEAVVEDIKKGHEIVLDVIGKAPKGFRAPHFGHYQNQQQLRLIYDTLRPMNYRYATTTIPAVTSRYGPVGIVDGIFELPLTGTFYWPWRILDSWGKLESFHQPKITAEYAHLLTQTVDRLQTTSVPALLNYYVDPAHVYQSKSFYQALEYLHHQKIPMLQYGDFLDLIT